MDFFSFYIGSSMVCGVKRSWKWVEIIPHTRYADFLVHRVALSLARGHGGVGRRRRGKKEMPHTEDTETQRGIVHRVELSLERRTQRRGEGTEVCRWRRRRVGNASHRGHGDTEWYSSQSRGERRLRSIGGHRGVERRRRGRCYRRRRMVGEGLTQSTQRCGGVWFTESS